MRVFESELKFLRFRFPTSCCIFQVVESFTVFAVQRILAHTHAPFEIVLTSSHRDVDNSMLTSGDHCFGFLLLESYRLEVVCLSDLNERASYSDPVMLLDESLFNLNIAKQ